ncbi:MAG TPA: nuclear transport factor 2 family protein [Ramlibacter sp.]|jgi:3-phenylpropionate/cinnamic acid dioxygenase small subunit|nr:nuclear transport factor 2 family protein [Ramlibacter sp.]
MHSDDERRRTEADCARLCVDFAHHLDARRYPQVLALFTPDGVLDRMGAVHAGHAEIARFLDARSTEVTTRHLCTNIRVDVKSPDLATGSCYVLFFQGRHDDGKEAVQASAPMVVEYHDRYSRTPEGWRIRERRIVIAMRP